jgi:hypothetical protein
MLSVKELYSHWHVSVKREYSRERDTCGREAYKGRVD